jgi:hypothetical protein
MLPDGILLILRFNASWSFKNDSAFLIPTTHELEEDTLTEDGWQRLIDIERYPETFPQEGYETDGEHGSV